MNRIKYKIFLIFCMFVGFVYGGCVPSNQDSCDCIESFLGTDGCYGDKGCYYVSQSSYLIGPEPYVFDIKFGIKDKELEQCLDTNGKIAFRTLALRNAGLYGELVPLKFVSYNDDTTLDLSHNKFTGTITDTNLLSEGLIASQVEYGPDKLDYLDLSYNELEGELPQLLFSKMVRLSTLKLNNNKFSGTIPDSIFENLADIVHLDLSNNEFTGCPKMLHSYRVIEYCDLRGNNFDNDCDFSGLNCMVDTFSSKNCTGTECNCPTNTECNVDNIVENISTEGNLKIKNIKISNDVVSKGDPIIITKNNGKVILDGTTIELDLEDDLISDIINNKRSTVVKVIGGNNNGNIGEIKFNNNRCVPLKSSLERDNTMGVSLRFTNDNEKCSNKNITIYVIIGVMAGILVLLIIVILIARFSETARKRIFPYEKRHIPSR